ncbi:NADH-quinone oxidoreductase subunit L [Pseudomonas sp.]|uniref:NADH-quinone oxidoreductase subunit L n=1 Tax=Pseudomonas sp. TaxID=306 RepID=UPI003CC5384A
MQLWLIPILPLAGFLINGTIGRRMPKSFVNLVAIGSVVLAFAWVLKTLLGLGDLNTAYTEHYFTWIQSGNLTINCDFSVDRLTAIMLLVVTGIGSLIHIYSIGYMAHEGGYYRFFAYLNLFMFFMLTLVLAANYLLLFVGWEGVGLCSYLLIGFYYSNRNNGNAALKAFIVTRIGDVFMAIGLFILFQQLGTLNIQELMVRAPEHFKAGDFWIVAATLMLLGGAVGKSAQLPLQTWLADAMAGPTPVSALIHAATMVTAGVYLIARTHGLFALAPDILHLVGIVGGVTLVLAGFAALVQTDIKRILAYSTMSQIGYMFLALGVGAWEGAIFHLMTHAFFKALLFLASGAVIVGCHHEQNIFKMGGLWKKLPLAYACFIVGGAALSALPILTVGFYSKDEILWEAFASGHTYLLYAGLVGAFMTSIYTFRLIFIAFHGEAKTDAHPGHGISHWLPLSVLIVLSTFVGAWIHPPLAGVLPESVGHAGGEAKHSLEIASGAIALAGILLAALLFLGKRRVATAIANSGPGRVLSAWWFAAWGFDWIYDKLFVKPYLAISHMLRKDPVDQTIGLIPRLAKGGNSAMSRTETGQLRWYAASIAAGAVLVLGAVVMASV